jgi:hypothetical protein
MNMTKSYSAIRAWGHMMQSFGYYIEDEVRRARRDDAPADAIYKGFDGEGKWTRLSDVTSPDTRWYFQVNHPDLLKEHGIDWNDGE